MHRLLIILWSVALSLSVLALIGTTNFLSRLIGATQVSATIEVGFFVLSGIFAVLLWRYVPPPRHRLTQILALLIPIAIFLIFLG